MEKEKLGTMVFDGKIYNLDSMSIEELDALELKLDEEEERLRNEIDRLIGLNNPDDDEDE